MIRLANAHGQQLDRELLFLVVETNDKQRFALDEARTKLRANQGHSIHVDRGLSPEAPPPLLFHGTADLSFSRSMQRRCTLPARSSGSPATACGS